MKRAFFVLAAVLAGCGGGGGGSSSAPGAGPVPAPVSTPTPGLNRVGHIVVIVQENRTVDNLFNGFPGADTVQSAVLADGRTAQLTQRSLADPADVRHSHESFIVQYANGAMNGFALEDPASLSMVPRSESGPYWDLASKYAFGDRMFQSNSGPSYPAHLYLIAGQSGRAADNPSPEDWLWGCDSPSNVTVETLTATGSVGAPISPCQDLPTLGDRLDYAGVSWRYYAPAITGTPGGGIWSAYSAIRHVRFGADWARNISSPETNVLADIAAGTLPQVSWVVPNLNASDHGGLAGLAGPDWVATIVNALGTSAYWSDTAIFVTWDDWGGWYDHVKPPQLDTMGLGFRVPLIVAGPYAKHHFVSHTQYEFGSILRFVETRFGIQPLAVSDSRATIPNDMFDFAQAPAAFTSISTTMHARDFSTLPQGAAPDK